MYPSAPSARDRFVLDRRRNGRRDHDPWQSHDVLVEDERMPDGSIASSATIFLTGRECPWRCLMCDLWQHTTTADTPVGAIAAQVTAGIDHVRGVRQAKLYNAGSFFDPHAVPDADYDAVARALCDVARVVVESHPALVGDRTRRFRDLLRERRGAADGPALEVAMGLETAHPDALDRLNKRMTCASFAKAAADLATLDVGLRVFLLVSPPFVPRHEADAWLARSVSMAIDCGATAISLIPTRGGNGALDAIAREGDFQPPSLADLERSVSIALEGTSRSAARIFADVWDLDRFASCQHCLGARRERLRAINLSQCEAAAVQCTHCGAGGRS